MKIRYINVLKGLFHSETQQQFSSFYAKCKSQLLPPKHIQQHLQQHDFQQQQEELEALSSETNQTKSNKILQQQAQEQQTMQTTFKSLTGSQILKIYADVQFFSQLLSNKEQYPRQIDQILWRITYLLGEVLMQIQNSLIDQGYLENGIVLTVKEIKETAYNIVELELATTDQRDTLLQEFKTHAIRIFEDGDYDEQIAIKMYNYAIKFWKRPLVFDLKIQPPIPPAQHKLVQTDPLAVQPQTTTPIVSSLPKPPNSLQFDRNRHLQTSQVKVFSPHQFKNPVNPPKQGKRGPRNKKQKPMLIEQNRPIPSMISDKNDIYEEIQSVKSVKNDRLDHELMGDELQQNIFLHNNRKPQKRKGLSKGKVIKQRLNAVKGKMALLKQSGNFNNPPNQPNPQPPSPYTQQIGNSFQQPKPYAKGMEPPKPNTKGMMQHSKQNSKIMMDLCDEDDKISLDQNKNRMIKQQMNGFRPPIFQEERVNLNQNSSGNLTLSSKHNKAMHQGMDRNTNKQIHFNNSLMPKPGYPRQSNPQKNHNPFPKGFQNNEIINLAQSRTTNNPSNKFQQLQPKEQPKKWQSGNQKSTQFLNNKVKLQQKLQEPHVSNQKLDLPSQIVSRPASIEPLTIPVITTSTVDTSKTQKTEGDMIQFRKRMREKWTPEQQSVLVQNYMQKGDELACSKILQQRFGQHPKLSPPGVKLRVEWIVRKVYQKFNSLNTKNVNINKFKSNWEFISKRCTSPLRRKIYKQIVAIYTAMLNMSEEKRHVISMKIFQINQTCEAESSNSA